MGTSGDALSLGCKKTAHQPPAFGVSHVMGQSKFPPQSHRQESVGVLYESVFWAQGILRLRGQDCDALMQFALNGRRLSVD
jgi:hypothetical protein|mmetsp:Transcript_3472/g.6682  ORF Transcript_3472/g.6682 Transcript_3472/m.6682 type:complete len:81 (+) Transcript_3472:442-684(+)